MKKLSMVLDPEAVESLGLFVAGKQDPQPKKAYENGEKTDKDRIEDGRKFYLVRVLVRIDGEPVENVSLTLRQKPNHELKDFEPLKLKGKTKVTVWGSVKKGSTFVTLHYNIEADGIEEASK